MKKVKYQCRQIDEDWCPSVEMPEPKTQSEWYPFDVIEWGPKTLDHQFKYLSVPLVRKIYPQL